jgi:hypothetical protein
VATRKQIEANRRNATRSTGPRTEKGKDASKLNAIRHGLLAKSVVVPNLENEEEWQDFRKGVLADLNPVGRLQEELAERIAQILWRIRRVAWHERNEVKKNYTEQAPVYWFDMVDKGIAGGRELPDLAQLGAIARYEAHLQRSFTQTLREYHRLRDRRQDEDGAMSTPIHVVPTDPSGRQILDVASQGAREQKGADDTTWGESDVETIR